MNTSFEALSFWGLIFFAPFIVLDEWRNLIIRNLTILALLATLAILVFLTGSLAALSSRLIGGVSVALFTGILWKFGRIGAGDVKLATVLTLFVPPPAYLVWAAAIITFSIFIIALQRVMHNSNSKFKAVADANTLPFGIPLSLATLSALGWAAF